MARMLVFMTLATVGAAPVADVPTIFAPGVISTSAHDSAVAFAPDDRSLVFGRSSAGIAFILESNRTEHGWSKPVITSFSGRWNDMEPAMAPNGRFVIFVSNRPAVEGGAPLDGMIDGQPQPGKGANLWRVTRTAAGWGKPERLPDIVNSGTSTYAPSIAANGDLYFMRPDGPRNRFRLFVAACRDGRYSAPVALSFSTGEDTDVDPAVLPDGSAIVFGSGRHAKKDIDLFISFRTTSGWSEPVYLGNEINGSTSDAEPRWGADRHTLYFSSERLEPIEQPIPTGKAGRALAELTSWNNGQYNIWKVDLARWLQRRP